MKKFLSLLLALVMVLSLSACGEAAGDVKSSAASESEASGSAAEQTQKIAVLVYSYSDAEVVTFRNYLENYIAEVFNVEFLYSNSITSEDEETAFIKQAAEEGAKGIMSFNSYDLKAEVDLCAEEGIYYMMASGTVSDEEFASVEDNEYFLGVVGPGTDMEYQAGADMAQHFVDEHEGNEYFILSGGASMGNAMHLNRTLGILETLEKAYNVTFDLPIEDLAASTETVMATVGDLSVVICPGYLDFDEYYNAAKAAYEENPYKNVLSVLPATAMKNVTKGANLGVVDCYSETNLQAYTDGDMDYLVGKYSSIIGPSFVAMYNAVCGYAADFRDNGKAFRLTQGFWSSDNREDYEKKYILASSIELNAYNYDDLSKVTKVYNENATLEDLKALAESYTYEDAVARRGL